MSVATKSVVAATVATSVQFIVGTPSISLLRIFTVNAVGCYVANRIVYRRPNESLATGLRRGVGYGILAAGISIFIPPADVVTFFVESLVAAYTGYLTGPTINKALGFKD